MKRENFPKSEKQIGSSRPCNKHFVAHAKPEDPYHIDYNPTVFTFVKN